MFIVFDPGEHGVFYLTYGVTWERFQCDLGRAGELLAAFARVLEEKKSSIEAVLGLGVIVGKGTFTATRVSTTLVNTLAFSHKIPVIACRELPDPHDIKELCASYEAGTYIQAVYSAEPRIHKKNPS